MNKIVTEQTLLFITAIQIGILMGVLFDLIRIFRKIIRHLDFFVQIEDMLYWIICAFMSFYILYICNYAAIRPFIFIGIVLGGILYYFAFSIWFMKFATIIINYVKQIINKLIKIVLKPVRWLCGVIIWPVKVILDKVAYVKFRAKVKYRKHKRVKYEQQMEAKVDQHLKSRKP